MLVLISIIMKDVIINETIVKKNKIANKKKSSTGPTSFSVSFRINNLEKEFKVLICVR